MVSAPTNLAPPSPLTFVTPSPDGATGQPQPTSATLVGQALPPALPLQDTRASVPPLSFVTPVPDGATGQPQPTSATLVGQAVPPALPLQDGRVSVPPPPFVTPVPDGATGQPQSASATLVGQALPPALPLPSSRASAQPSLSPSQQSDAAVGGTSELDSDSAPLVRRFVTSATYFPGRPDVGPMVGPGGRCAPASASTPEGIAIPRPATAKLALSPSAQPLPGKLGFSASPSRTWLSGTIQGDRPTGSFVSGVGENASPATEPGAPVATVPLAAWAEQAAFPNPVQHPHESATPAQGGGESAAANSDAAPLAASGSGAGKLAVTSRQFARPSASTTQTAALPRRTTATAGLAPSVGVLPAPGKIGSSASLSRTRASGTIQGAPPTGSLASGVGENAGPATASGAPAANMPLGSWVEQAASPNPVWNPHASAAPAQGGGESAAGKPAGATGRAQRPSTSTAEAVATPRPATATAKLAPAASAQPVPGKIGFSAIPSWTRASVAMQADRPTGRLASGVGENASPASAPSAPAPPVPLAAWFQQAASPNPVPNPGESATPAQSGGKSSDHGSPASDALQFPAGGKETGNPDLAAPAAISLQPQAPPASRRFSQIAKDGVEDPASGAPDGADSAPVVAANRAGAQAASTIARLPFAPAAPSDTGIAPPAVPGSTPEKPGLTVSGPEPRAAGADAGTPGKAEPAPADLAVAVKVKPQASVAASAQSAPTREPRRVDLADPPPATRLHTETSRTGAWAAGEAPARGGAQLAAQTAAQSATRPPERPEATPLRAEESASKAAPLKDLSIQVAQSDREGVELRVVEREGELHIAVRTGDADLAHGLRQGLPELVNRLDQGGYRTEAWRPAGMVSGSEPSSQAHTRSSDSRNPDSQSQPGWSQQERGQRDHNQSNRPKWVEELEGNLAGGGERSTGEFHGFTN